MIRVVTMGTEFTAWLRRQGADVLSPTNPYEVARFRAHGSVHVIYQDKRGIITAAGDFGQKCIDAWKKGANLPMGFTGKRTTLAGKIKASILARDGDACFFCATPVTSEDISIEHLVAVAKGGPNHSDNYALAHEACNKKADNLPLMEKIKIHRRAWAASLLLAKARALEDLPNGMTIADIIKRLESVP